MSSELVVAKFGSDVVVNKGFDTQERLYEYAETLLAIHEPRNLIIVTSGAVAFGSEKITRMGDVPERFTLQQKATIGSSAITEAWHGAFMEHQVLAGSMLITHHEIEDRREGESALELIAANRSSGMVTILNENDALSNKELMKLATGGDNDGLARHFGEKIGAGVLFLYTKSGGVFDQDKKIIPVVNIGNVLRIQSMLETREIDPDKNGTGGILSKHVQAARFTKVGEAFIAPAPTKDQDISRITHYLQAA